MYEHHSKPIISTKKFILRLVKQLVRTFILLVISLIIGTFGYHYLESFSWIDSFLNSSMLLGGMGEINELQTVGGKIFASLYALYSAIFMIVCGGFLLVPVFHRTLHHFHAAQKK